MKYLITSCKAHGEAKQQCTKQHTTYPLASCKFWKVMTVMPTADHAITHEKQWLWCPNPYIKPPLKSHNFLKFMYFDVQWQSSKSKKKQWWTPSQATNWSNVKAWKQIAGDVQTHTSSHHWNSINFGNLCTLMSNDNHAKNMKRQWWQCLTPYTTCPPI